MRANVNVGGSDINLDYKFINFMKGSQRIITNGGPATTWYFDANITDDCYPLEATNGVAASIQFMAGTYVCRWLGSGAVDCSAWGSKTNSSSGIYTGGGANATVVTNGRFTFTIGLGYKVVTIKGTTINNLQICLASEEANLDAGQIFRPAYISRMQGQNGILRMMAGPGNINNNMSHLWADRALPSSITYNSRLVAGKKVGSVTGTGTYSIAGYSGFPASPTNGTLIHFYIPPAQATVSTTGNTLQVDSWPVKPLSTGYYGGTPVISPSGFSGLCTAVYNSTLDMWLLWFGTGQFGVNFFSACGHPWEIQIAECNAINLPGWFNIPFFADNNYVTNLATLISQTYTPSTIYVEYHNEIWNTAFGFAASFLAPYMGNLVLGIPVAAGNAQALSGWYGYRMGQIADLMRPILGGRLKVVLASQGAQGDSPSSLTNVIENARFQNNTYPAISGANAPITKADVVSYAHYFGAASLSEFDNNWSKFTLPYVSVLRTAIDNYNAGATDTAFETLISHFKVQIDGTGAVPGELRGTVMNRATNWNTLATSYNKPIQYYEMNWEIQAPTATWCSGASLLLYANSNRAMTTNASSAVQSMGLLVNTNYTGGTGDTLSVNGLYGGPVLNKAGAAITGSTLLSGTAGTDSITTNFVAGNTITVNSQTITFVASGAVGNNQINVTDSIATLLAKIDIATGTTTPSTVLAPVFDSSYGGTAGKIDLFVKAFYASAYASLMWQYMLQKLGTLPKVAAGGVSLFADPGGWPWVLYQMQASISGQSSTYSSDSTLPPLGNWEAVRLNNNSKRRFLVRTG